MTGAAGGWRPTDCGVGRGVATPRRRDGRRRRLRSRPPILQFHLKTLKNIYIFVVGPTSPSFT